jgi:hypothetical protein
MDSNDVYLSRTSQRKRYNISPMTLWRWERDPHLNFPPAIEINGRKYRSLRSLEAWERERAVASVSHACDRKQRSDLSTGTSRIAPATPVLEKRPQSRPPTGSSKAPFKTKRRKSPSFKA